MKKILLFVGLMFCLMTSVAFADEKEAKSVKEQKVESNQFIIVNKAVNKLAFYEDGRLVNVFSVATGASPSATPEGDFHVEVKWECPVYYKGKNGPCENGNPLGPRWIGLSVPGTAGYTYGIHGNAAEWSIGTYASNGCVRMHNWQVTQLFEIVKKNTPVTIIRSNKSFDEIAKDKGYAVKQPEKKNETATIIGKTNVYYGSHEGLILKGESLENKEVIVKETIGQWKHIQTKEDKKTYWVNTENMITGAMSKENSYLLVGKNGTVYTYPKEESATTKVENAQILESTLHVGDWYYVTMSKKESSWVQLKDVEKVTEKEWNIQKNMPVYTKEWVENWAKFDENSTDFWLLMKEILM